jgi:hypothetical protein
MVQTQLLPETNDTEWTSVLSTAVADSRPAPSGTLSPIRPLQDALGAIFPTTEHDARLQQARRIMTDEIAEVSDKDLGTHLTELQYLIDSLMDDFERTVFEGKTLKQLMRG